MADIISIVNQKGGVAKTTTTVNLGAALAMSEKRTLIVDMDPQANSTSGLGISKYDSTENLYNCIVDGLHPNEIIKSTELEYLRVLPSNKNLVGAEIELIDQEKREFRLSETLAPIADDYDYILIDAPPSLGLLTINAMVAATQLLIPIQAEYYALEGVSELMDTMKRVKSSFNNELSIRGFVITMIDDRTNLSRQVEDEVRNAFGDLVYTAVIPRNIRIAEAPSFGKPVILYDIASKGASAYLKLTKEFLANG